MFSIHMSDISKLVNIIRRIEYSFQPFIEIQILRTLRISISICRMLLRQKESSQFKFFNQVVDCRIFWFTRKYKITLISNNKNFAMT